MRIMQMFLGIAAAEAALLTPWALRFSASSLRSRTPAATAIEPTEESAQAQREEYFELMPSKQLPKVSLDLRAWANTDDDAFEVEVFAKQTGTVSDWQNIGRVAVENEALANEAVAKQRDLIARWAYELINNFETNERMMDLDAPIDIAWAVRPKKPGLLDTLFGKEEDAIQYTEVPSGTGFDKALRCGFLGSLAREYRGGGVSARYDRIVIGKDPEVPIRDPFQEQFNSKYKKGKTIV